MIQYRYVTICLVILAGFNLSESRASEKAEPQKITLPKPDIKNGMPLNSALEKRRSHRRFTSRSLSLPHLSQILWSAQGVTHIFGFRTAPSAGALYPVEIYAVVSNVEQLEPGIYHYEPGSHHLEKISGGEQRKALAKAVGKQGSIANAPVTLVITGIIKRTAKKYGKRARQYIDIETGSIAQNIYLQATSLQLGTVFVGSFKDQEVKQVMQLPGDHEPLGLMPVGHR